MKKVDEVIKKATKFSETLEWLKRRSHVDKFFSDDFNTQNEVVHMELLKYKNFKSMFAKNFWLEEAKMP